MSRVTPCLVVAACAALLSACAVAPPPGPSVMALPAQGKSFADFQQDDAICQQYAAQQTGYATPAQAASNSAVGSAAIGTVVGAAAGAAIGAAAGNPAMGAAIGAGSGLLVGSAAGLGNAQVSGAALQQRYDMRYIQCMSAKGESVPVPVVAAAPSPGSVPYPAYAYPAYGPYPYYGPPYYYGPVIVGGGPRWGYPHRRW